MTKKDMMYEIISHTRLNSVSERQINSKLAKISKARVEEVYKAFTKDQEHALFYYSILVL